MKSERQKKILELIVRYEIETQDELIEKLRTEGFDVTQATASRDIKELKLSKTQTNKGKYRYVRPLAVSNTGEDNFNVAFAASIISVELGENIVVVKTYPGMANALAVCVDSLEHENIIGSVAGDDTILLVSKTDENAVSLAENLKKVFGE